MSESKLSPEEKKVLKEINKEKKDNVVYTSFLETDDYILEQVSNATRATRATRATGTRFCIYNKKTGTTDIKDNFIYKGVEYCPIVDKVLLEGGILLPSEPEEYETVKKLTEKISKFLFNYFEVSPFFEKFLPYLVMFYWVYEKFPFVPYLHFVGLTGTGKTTAQEVFGSICYKPIDTSGSITVSPIFRIATQWRGTLLLDEFEPNGESYKEMMALLKSGVSNKVILRTEGDKKKEVSVYVIKSPKVFTSENPINNAGLQSRTIVIRMEKNKKRVPLYRLQGFLDEALSIRNQLLLWRLRSYNSIDLKEIEFGFEELSSFDGRVQQVITPIYYLSDGETKEKIVEFAKIQQMETFKERQESIDGQIFQVISDKFPENISIKDIAKEINFDLALKKVSEKRIGLIIRKVLGFEIKRIGHENLSSVIVDSQEIKINELRKYFGLLAPTERVASVARVADDNTDGQNALKSATRLKSNATHSENATRSVDELWEKEQF